MFCVARYSLAEIWRSKRSCTVPLAGWVARFARTRYTDPNPKVYFFTFALIHVAHPLNSRRRVKKKPLRLHSSNSPKCPPLSSWFLAGPSSARHFRPLVQKSVSHLFSPTQAHGSWEIAKTPAEPSSNGLQSALHSSLTLCRRTGKTPPNYSVRSTPHRHQEPLA